MKRFVSLLSVSLLCAGLLMGGLADSVQAQDPIMTPTPVVVATEHTAAFISDSDIVTFDLLGQDEIELIGPYDAATFTFAMPADWVVSGGGQLNLSIGVSFNTGAQSQLGSSGGSKGTLLVSFNTVVLAVLPLSEVGEIERVLPIPAEAFTSARDDGRMALRFSLDSRSACYGNDGNDQVSVFIHSRSYLTIPHESIRPDTSLENFPRPIFQNSFNEDFVLLVIPDQPSAAELQAALTAASGLGNITGNNLTMDMTTLGKLTSEQVASTNLIYVGNAASLPVLNELDLPQPVSEGKFEIAEGAPDDGVIQMINSPWSNERVILVVSGNTDLGVIKAAQAIGSDILFSGGFPNLAVVQQVQTTPVSIAQPTHQTLTDLGYEGTVFQNRGVASKTYNFHIPVGMTIAPDAYFELIYGHSALLDYELSGIVVVLNGSPIGSVSLDDATAGQATNQTKITIPTSAVVPGNNRLEVKANLALVDTCSPPSLKGLWINLWPESTLYLPLALASVNPVSSLDLATYPAPFVYDPMLSNTAFVLGRNDLESWRLALRIAAFLGQQSNGTLSAFSVFYGDEVPEIERAQYNLLVIGSPSQMPVVSEMNNFFPAPFVDGSDNAAMENNFQITYRIPTDSPLGYIQMIPSPWNPDNVVLAILGNQAQGVSWAALSLIEPELRSRLAGNFAVINDRQIMISDTRLTPTIAGISTQVPGIEVVLPEVSGGGDTTPRNQSTVAWVLPALIASVVLIILVLAVVVIRRWMRTRARIKTQKPIKRKPE